MPDDIAIAAEIPIELDEAPSRLASSRGQSKSELVREALQFYVQSEEDFIIAVEEGLADIRAARLIDHKDVMREIQETFDAKR